MIGKIKGKTEKPYKDPKKGTYLNIKLDNTSFNIFDEDMQKLVKETNFEESLKVTYTEKEGNIPGSVFKNVVTLEKAEGEQEQIIKEEYISDEPQTKKAVEKAPVKTTQAPVPQIFDQDFWKNKFYDRTEGGIDQHLGKCNHDAINIIGSLLVAGTLRVDDFNTDGRFNQIIAVYKELSKKLFRTDKEIRTELKPEIDEIIKNKTK